MDKFIRCYVVTGNGVVRGACKETGEPKDLDRYFYSPQYQVLYFEKDHALKSIHTLPDYTIHLFEQKVEGLSDLDVFNRFSLKQKKKKRVVKENKNV